MSASSSSTPAASTSKLDLAGMQDVKATLGFLLISAYRHLFSRALTVQFSFGDGWYCLDELKAITQEEINKVKKQMDEWIEKEDIEETHLPRKDVLAALTKANMQQQLDLLKIWRVDPVPVIAFANKKFWDFRLRKHETSRQKLLLYSLLQYRDGLLIRYPYPWRAPSDTSSLALSHHTFVDQPHLFKIYQEFQAWGKLLGVENVTQLNAKVYSGEIRELLWVAEGLHEKMISAVATNIVKDFDKKRIICLAGPSSSGKTTTAKRISIQLKVNGHDFVLISMDDYYNEQANCPRLGDGTYDYDDVAAVNIPLLAERIQMLLDGKEIPVRHYNFPKHSGEDHPTKRLRLSPRGMVIVEGIHGLNPSFTDRLGGHDKVNLVYVSAITHLNIDSHHHVSTADNRLLRRILRDFRTRGFGVEDTLQRWDLVRLNEERYIFPYQRYADYCINTALVYELPILANYVRPLLAEASGDPAIEAEASRLLAFLNLFYPLTEEHVPANSILREFYGGSAFDTMYVNH